MAHLESLASFTKCDMNGPNTQRIENRLIENPESSMLPRLLYIGDVPVEATAHGSALLYRLLQDYPPENLRIVEANIQKSTPTSRLAGVRYSQLHIGWERPLRTRLNRFWSPWLLFFARYKEQAIDDLIRGFQPEAVLTVHHGYSWVAAARYAKRCKLPLHLILHDDWNRMVPFPECFRPWIDSQFAKAYRRSSSRLCVSPYMVDEYQRRYGVSATLLYPSRSKNCLKFDHPPARLSQQSKNLTVAYAGNIFMKGYWNALSMLGDVLAPMNGKLIIFGQNTREQAELEGMLTQNVRFCGLLKSEDLVVQLRAEADVLFIPMSFDEADRANMEISFPSKLTDSTIPGVPLLIFGPEYCSAVRWARENPGVAEVVTVNQHGALFEAVTRLTNPSHWSALAEAALQKGNEYFSHFRADQLFRASLVNENPLVQ